MSGDRNQRLADRYWLTEAGWAAAEAAATEAEGDE